MSYPKNDSAAKRLLPWLPLPGEDEVEVLSRLSTAADAAKQLVRLARFDWRPSDSRRLVSAAKKLRETSEWPESLTPIRLLLFSNASSKYLTDALQAAGFRHGLDIQPMVVEYEEPEDFIAREVDLLASFDPQIVALNIDGSKFSFTAPLGDVAASAGFAARAADRLSAIRNCIREKLGAHVIWQTLSPSPNESRLHVDRMLAGSYKDQLNRINTHICELAHQHGDLLLDVASLAENVGLMTWFSPRYWSVGKYPFSPDVAPVYADHLARLIAVRFGKSRRVLVLDLDNTLWGGIVGDDGKDGLILGSGSAIGEAHQAIQHYAQKLAKRGVILCVSSKNEESVALDAFRNHPEMVLREEDIAAFQINWQDKAANIRELSRQLNLGLESFVFLDDNPVERMRVRDALPDVAVPEVPNDVAAWTTVLQAACYFESTGFSKEDEQRTEYYKANAKRSAQIESFADNDAFLKSLDMEMEVKPFDAPGRMRIAQLIAKSNQFNLTTRRYSEDEVASLAQDDTVRTYQVRLRDMFGDNGMVSVVILRDAGDSFAIDTWLMSCRVLGRRLEEAILDLLAAHATEAKKLKLTGTYIPTKKNMMVKNHFSNLGFTRLGEDGDGTSHWELPLADYKIKVPPIKILAAGPEPVTQLEIQ